MKSIIVKKDEETGELYLDLEDFKDVVDIKKIKSYSMELIEDDEDKGLLVKFYNSKGKVINCKGDK